MSEKDELLEGIIKGLRRSASGEWENGFNAGLAAYEGVLKEMMIETSILAVWYENGQPYLMIDGKPERVAILMVREEK